MYIDSNFLEKYWVIPGLTLSSFSFVIACLLIFIKDSRDRRKEQQDYDHQIQVRERSAEGIIKFWQSGGTKGNPKERFSNN